MLKSSPADGFDIDNGDDGVDDDGDVADADSDGDVDDDDGQERLVEVQQMLKSSPAVGFLTQIGASSPANLPKKAEANFTDDDHDDNQRPNRCPPKSLVVQGTERWCRELLGD